MQAPPPPMPGQGYAPPPQQPMEGGMQQGMPPQGMPPQGMPPHGMHQGMAPVLPPSPTIYVNNINDKVKKDDLKKALYAIFGQFGTVLDVVVYKTLRLRGQAWVVFDDINAATTALRTMQGYPFMDKPIRIQFAKEKSDAIAKKEGSWTPKDRREENKRKNEEFARRIAEKRQRQAAALATAGASAEEIQAVASTVPQVYSGPGQAEAQKIDTPNHILFAQDLPDQATQQALTVLFKQYQGFKEVRMVPGKKGIAFIEFETEVQATDAMLGLQGFALTPDSKLKLSYAKK